jgi:hypothetical protein
MSWTVIKEDENGNSEEQLSEEFHISGTDILYSSNFRVIKYLDPYGDTTFNAIMFDDLITDLTELKTHRPYSAFIIDKIIQLATSCKNDVHSYLKFYGD